VLASMVVECPSGGWPTHHADRQADIGSFRRARLRESSHESGTGQAE
jgi:hypothetical protein